MKNIQYTVLFASILVQSTECWGKFHAGSQIESFFVAHVVLSLILSLLCVVLGSRNSGALKSWQLRFHGTKDNPGASYENCAGECKGGCSGPNASDCVECVNYKSNGVSLNHSMASFSTETNTESILCAILITSLAQILIYDRIESWHV